ncbi:hypothetical protein ABE26_22305 [Cytobacillus firmus]|nr:hypothetical protein [Cytobacillus firmus]
MIILQNIQSFIMSAPNQISFSQFYHILQKTKKQKGMGLWRGSSHKKWLFSYKLLFSPINTVRGFPLQDAQRTAGRAVSLLDATPAGR